MKTISLKVSSQTQMTCHVSEPKQTARAAVIVLQEAFGVNDHVQKLTERFAGEGYLAIAPELYHRTAPPGWTCDYKDFKTAAEPHFAGISERGLIEDVRACYDWAVDAHKIKSIGCTGYCMGGRASFIANSEVPLTAAVSYYGGRIVPSHIHLSAKQIAPLLFFWGGKDANILPDQIRRLNESLTEAKKPFTNIVISDADHGFFTDDRSSYNPIASRLAWATTMEFFKIHLLS